MKLAVGIPAYRGSVNVHHVPEEVSIVASMLATQGRVQWGGFFTVDSACVAHARNHIVHEATKAGADWLLMIDADTYYLPAGDRLHPAIPMVMTACAHGAHVIAAPVLRRGAGTYNATVHGRIVGPEDFRERVIEVDRAGTAYMAVDLNWLRSQGWTSPWFTMGFPKTAEPSWVGEDFSFCDDIRARGGLILLDGRFEPVHVP